MSKSFSPIIIQNPKSVQQIAKVCPGQEILVYLDNEIFGEHVIDVSTDLLKLEFVRNKSDDSGKSYRVTHSSLVHDWAEYSSTMLGEIWIDGKSSIAKIGVLLGSNNENKNNVKTVVNPDCFDLRICPHNVIEVIVYDIRFGYHDEWNYEWKKVKNIGLEEMGRDHLCLHSLNQFYNGLEKPDYLYARLPRVEPLDGFLTKQHHFWFRFDSKMFKFLELESGIVHVGNIVINGSSRTKHTDKISYHVSLHVDCRNKFHNKIQETLNLKLVRDSTPDYVSTNLIPVKQVLPHIRDVEVTLIEIPGEITGCKTLIGFNESYNFINLFDDEVDVYSQYQQNYCNQKLWRR